MLLLEFSGGRQKYQNTTVDNHLWNLFRQVPDRTESVQNTWIFFAADLWFWLESPVFAAVSGCFFLNTKIAV
ncbi:MAG: hypothetical protein V4616_00975 [Bacteroidota bacterium]